MGAFTALTVKESCPVGNLKFVIFTALGPASYDSGGSTLDLSNAAAGFGDHWNGLSEVYACSHVGFSAAADSKYRGAFIPATAGAAATGKMKLHDTSQAADAEASGDLSSVTFIFMAIGR